MERVTGIGGVFFLPGDPEALVAWYEEHVGVPLRESYVVFPESGDSTGPVHGGHGLLAE